ncbi:MAG: hypothetical protein A3K59_09680 [Euryarchaeota archaeon RBG_19FT_COMBO_69_17]|nr:MAG: hypothetical protein A3K59_09680 [Euryarchaeota archaeon RBG_19FT_COMBO_69_17]
MTRPRLPELRLRTVFFLAFAAALLLLLARTWQLAFLAGFLAGMFSPRASRAVLFGGLGVALAWAAYLAYVYVVSPAAALSALVVEILGLDASMGFLVPVLTVLLGFLVGAVGGLVGYTGSRVFTWRLAPSEPGAPKA